MWFTIYPFKNLPIHLTCLLGSDGNLYIKAKDVGLLLLGYSKSYLSAIMQRFKCVRQIPKLPEKCFTNKERQTRVVTVEQMKEWLLEKNYRSWWVTGGGISTPGIDGEEMIRRLDVFWSLAYVTVVEDEFLTNGEYFPHYLLFESLPGEVGSRPIGPWWADAWNVATLFYERYERPPGIPRWDAATVLSGGEVGPTNDDPRPTIVVNDVVKMFNDETGKWDYYTKCLWPSDEKLVKQSMEDAKCDAMTVVPAPV